MVRADINPCHWPLLSTTWPLVLNRGWYNWPMEVNIRMEIHGPHFIANPEVWLRQGRGTIKCEAPCDLKTALERTKYCTILIIKQKTLQTDITFQGDASRKESDITFQGEAWRKESNITFQGDAWRKREQYRIIYCLDESVRARGRQLIILTWIANGLSYIN